VGEGEDLAFAKPHWKYIKLRKCRPSGVRFLRGDLLWVLLDSMACNFSRKSLVPESVGKTATQDDGIPDEEDEDKNKISKKQRKQMNKISVAQLKSRVQKPGLVE
jgi:hypothetical protein